jgi:hypothetical protein
VERITSTACTISCPRFSDGIPVKDKAAATLDQTLANFSKYNDKLAGILARDSLTAKDWHEVHQLTLHAGKYIGEDSRRACRLRA